MYRPTRPCSKSNLDQKAVLQGPYLPAQQGTCLFAIPNWSGQRSACVVCKRSLPEEVALCLCAASLLANVELPLVWLWEAQGPRSAHCSLQHNDSTEELGMPLVLIQKNNNLGWVFFAGLLPSGASPKQY